MITPSDTTAVANFQNVDASALAVGVSLTGSTAANILTGGAGSDTVDGGGGADVIATGGGQVTYSGGGAPQGALAMAAAAGAAAAEGGYEELELPPAVEQRRVDEHEQLGRNDPCWCGSGKKYKKCHGA